MPRTQAHGRHNCLTTDIIPRSSYLFSFDGLTFTAGHLFRECLLALFLDIANASGAVGIKQECEHLAYPVGEQLAFLDLMGALRASVEIVLLATRADFTPSRLFISLASGTFLRQELTAGSAIKTASGYVLSVRHDGFHKRQILE